MSIERLKNINKEYSRKFCLPEEQLLRYQFRAQHPIGIFGFGCMDGRNNIPNATELPAGIMQNYRYLGGAWEWWNYLDQVFYNDLMYFINQGRQCLVFVSYHFSKSEKHLGCAGFDFDTEAAIKANIGFLKKIERVYGAGHSIVFPILLGLETDEESLVIHGKNHDKTLHVADLESYDEDSLKTTLTQMFTSIQPEMMKLLLRLIKGNINHIATIRASHRLVAELNHCEWVIAVGNGLDWFYKPNQAIIVGMYSNRPEEAIKKAADIIKKNLDEGRISKESGFVLLASSSFHSEAGVEKPRACERSKENMKFATEVITQYHPELLEMMHQLTVVTNLDNRKFIEVKDVDLD